MKRNFVKMHGCGNDYIYFDCFEEAFPNPEEVSRKLSRYHFGIGGDGVILIEPSEKADGRMRIFNQDGSEGKMCGNGIRCVGKYLYDSGRVRKETMKIETLSGIRTLQIQTENGKATWITVDMGPAIFAAKEIPVDLGKEEVIEHPIHMGEDEWKITCVSMGNPHCVVFCQNPESLDLPKIGPGFEKNPIFPEGVNTEFIRVEDSHTLTMRVWERGSGETMACGTGACASAVAAIRCGFCEMNEEITVHLRGGDLKIRWDGNRVWMTGPAETVFTGEVEL